ncbi:helix-turn-helix domain-containing protein [Arthrobacter sp. VKM Ac-2550]|uniref:helix-turn-helix domain-containing protein n=1 Tax=Crystallibacter permensis TaxID=1938888 RepID=UPI002227A7F6|nr:LysR family transcriptional regulator [Arthrobacter sp. VKM Ac-2550]
MNPVSNATVLPQRRLLSGLLHTDTNDRDRENLWISLGLGTLKRSAVLAFREKESSEQLPQRIAEADPDCIAVTTGADTIAIAPRDTPLRRFAEMTAGVRVGIGPRVPVARIHLSYHHALDVLPFTGDGSPVSRVISHAELGNLTLLARVPRDDLLKLPDLPALQAIERKDGGRAELEALEALCRTGTLRRAAKALHLHHSSVARRIGNVEEVLGYRLIGPIPLTSAYAAVLALRLLKSDRAPHEINQPPSCDS